MCRPENGSSPGVYSSRGVGQVLRNISLANRHLHTIYNVEHIFLEIGKTVTGKIGSKNQFITAGHLNNIWYIYKWASVLTDTPAKV
jgi:hypothetical protein